MRWSRRRTRFISRYIRAASASSILAAPLRRPPSSPSTCNRPSAGSSGARGELSSLAAALIHAARLGPCVGGRESAEAVAEDSLDGGILHARVLRGLCQAVARNVAELTAGSEI